MQYYLVRAKEKEMPTVQARLSVQNWAQSATITADSAAADWPASNLRYPQSPMLGWRSTSTALNQIYVDFGTPRLIEMVVLVHLNAVSTQIALATTPAGVDYVSPLTATQPNWWNRRNMVAFLVTPEVTRRYLRVGLTPGSTTDGAAYFHMGGIWAGPLVALPRDIRWDEQMVTMEPVLDLQPQHQGWRQRLKTGDPYTVIRARRLAVTANGAAAGVNAELDQWNVIDYYLWDHDAIAWYSNRGNNSHAWIMGFSGLPGQPPSAAWPIHQTVSEGDLVLEEVMGP
jgi:hypothetical protein